jgi:putative glutamine amidotransferase
MQTLQKSPSNKKPVILITTSNINSPELGGIIGDTDIAYADKATAQTIAKAGGIPLYVPTSQLFDPGDLEVYVGLADGFVLPGADSHINPALYGEVAEADNAIIDDQRDQIDIQLVRLAHERKMPLLGICKGMQIMNIALGGTLHQKIPSQSKLSVDHSIPKRRTFVTHEAILADGSFLKGIFGSSKLGLNGGHQQAVNQLSSDIRASAIAEDGIVEAYEGINYPFLLGIQFHAELLESSAPHLAIFKRFIEAASAYKLNKSKERL